MIKKRGKRTRKPKELTTKEIKLKEDIFRLIIGSNVNNKEVVKVLALLLNSFRRVEK